MLNRIEQQLASVGIEVGDLSVVDAIITKIHQQRGIVRDSDVYENLATYGIDSSIGLRPNSSYSSQKLAWLMGTLGVEFNHVQTLLQYVSKNCMPEDMCVVMIEFRGQWAGHGNGGVIDRYAYNGTWFNVPESVEVVGWTTIPKNDE